MIFMVLSEEEPLTAQHKFLTLTLACLDRVTVLLLQLWLPWQHRQPIRLWWVDQQSFCRLFGFIAAVPDVGLGQDTSSAWSPVSSVSSREVCAWSHAVLRPNPFPYEL